MFRAISSGVGLARFSTAPSSERLAGKVAVITGAASGMGKETAAEFVRNGAKVILTDIQDDLGRAVAAELGPDASYACCDVTNEEQIAAAVDLAVARHGRLDVLHNHAGVAGRMTLDSVASLDLADFDRTMAANARSAVAGIKHAARVMVPRRSGCIICTARTAGVLGSVNPAYCISKAAVIGAVRALAGELVGRHGVRVNAISPHGIATPFGLRGLAELLPEASEEELRRLVESGMSEMGGMVLEVEDIARAALYLASDEATYVNGHNLVVDGGFTVGKLIHTPDPVRS
uniref:Momilactone A synthase n=2 Tax=Aegilops tauschii subsp. strangulata TaxID=200361 RepID=A0A453AS48_AEGTS